jgi:hypothetical protein
MIGRGVGESMEKDYILGGLDGTQVRSENTG